MEGEINGVFYVCKIGGGNYEVFLIDFGCYYWYDFFVGFSFGLNVVEMSDKELQIYFNLVIK